ncbi:ATP-binding cassette domain-containing protein [Corynebacterium pseudotuberculosis]|uniref:ATP-binding cassette domain-containing protein n=1 Tax=Corynebacterium pseudotuberculosis TaxID=1719 RepID=UPI0009776D03|nr:ATP-binding cassette domain-containing protein [Corynebacterium pseudotuberculosis]QGX59112.1 ATP-binding cassette domain-containing protein [Corynebacterium pseudotuberculosis]
MTSIELTDVDFSYNSCPLLNHISLRVGAGERACLVGPNGCGKSTLVNWVAAGAPPTTAHSDASGTITRDDRLVLIPNASPSKAIPVSQKPYGMKVSDRWAQELFIPPCGISRCQHCLRAINGALR